LKINSDKFEPEFLICIVYIKEITEKFNIPFILIGATVRDIIFEYQHGIKAPRITMDIDIAVEIDTWNSFDEIKNELTQSYGFVTTDEVHKFRYKSTFIDIIPYGNIAKDGKLIWRENQNTMNVEEFLEVYSRAQTIQIQGYTEIKIPTLEDLTILKFISWRDSYPIRSKDALDISFILKNYEMTLDKNFIFDNYPEIIEKEKFDLYFAGIVILGLKMKEICSLNMIDKLKNILIREINEEYSLDLLIQMDGNVDESRVLLQKLLEGIK
jgi:predicted nucleotidyltransferase